MFKEIKERCRYQLFLRKTLKKLSVLKVNCNMKKEKAMDERSLGVSSSPTFEDLGIPVTPSTHHTPLGPARTLARIGKWEWIYLSFSLVSLFTSLGFIIQKLIILDKSTEDYTFAIVLCFATVFCIYYVINGIITERVYELIVFVCSTVIVWIYIIVNFFGDKENYTDRIKLARILTASILSPLLIIGGIWLAKMYHDSRNLIFKTVGANLELQSMCATLFLCSSLIKFDLQLQGSMLILVLNHGTELDIMAVLVLSIGTSVTILWAAIGLLAMRYEKKIFVWIFLVVSFSNIAYIIYIFTSVNKRYEGFILYHAILICGIFAITVRVAVDITMVFVMRNFGKGLKAKVFMIPEPEPEED